MEPGMVARSYKLKEKKKIWAFGSYYYTVTKMKCTIPVPSMYWKSKQRTWTYHNIQIQSQKTNTDLQESKLWQRDNDICMNLLRAYFLLYSRKTEEAVCTQRHYTWMNLLTEMLFVKCLTCGSQEQRDSSAQCCVCYWWFTGSFMTSTPTTVSSGFIQHLVTESISNWLLHAILFSI